MSRFQSVTPIHCNLNHLNERPDPTDFSKCLYTFQCGDKKGKQCGMFSVSNDGFCSFCLTQRPNVVLNPLYQSLLGKNTTMILKCIDELNYTNEQLHEVLKRGINERSDASIIRTVFASKRYFPEAYNYMILFLCGYPDIPKEALFDFFHKRFLIKSIVIHVSEHFDIGFIDLLSLILDPLSCWKIRS
jgi:hypothetical protein